MKRMNKETKTRKRLTILFNFILIILYLVFFMVYGISIGYFVYSLLTGCNNIIKYLTYSLLTGIIYIIIILLLVYINDNNNIKSLKWYINYIFISIIKVLVITSMTVFYLSYIDDNRFNCLIGISIIPFIGLISIPNIIKKYLVNKKTR